MSRVLLCLLAVGMIFGSVSVHAQRTQDVLVASYREAFGAANGPNADEIKYWMGRTDWQNQADMVRFHMQGLQTNDGLRDKAVRAAFLIGGDRAPAQPAVDHWKGVLSRQPQPVAGLARDIGNWTNQRSNEITASYVQAFGRSPEAGELTYWGGRMDWNGVAGLTKLHRAYIRANASVQDAVIRASYARVFPGRSVYPGEMSFWKPLMAQNAYFCSELELAHRDWIARNVAVAKQNPKVAAALRNGSLGIDNVGYIAPLSQIDGAGNLKPGTRVVAGNQGNASARNNTAVAPGTWSAAKLIGLDGSTMIGTDGGTLVGNDGASLIGNDGAGLIGNDSAGFRLQNR